jgi:Uncharacterized proteins, homologs of microcin C7 resistance protein MccF
VPFGKTPYERVREICGKKEVPLETNFPGGHGTHQATLPISLPVEWIAERDLSIKPLEPAVQ